MRRWPLCSQVRSRFAPRLLVAGLGLFAACGTDVDETGTGARVFDGFEKLGLEVAWRTQIGSGYSGVAVAGGKAVTMYSDGESDLMAAFDAGDGRRLWTHAFAETYRGHGGSHTGPISTPLIADGRVFGLSRQGKLFALDVETGQEAWSTDLVKDYELREPFYGFATSPILESGVLIVELGGEGKAVGGFDPATGEQRWLAGTDGVRYQSPVLVKLHGRRQVVAAGNVTVLGLDPRKGEVLWQYAHQGSGDLGAASLVPVPAGDGRLFLAHKDDLSMMVELRRQDGGIGGVKVWEDRAIRNSYNVPVYHDGYLYGYSSRFLTCVDAATGESRWRSRQPGDGFLILVDRHLVIVTRNGSVHVAEATPEGYRELAGLPVLADLSWTPPSFAGGRIYVRSLGEIARIDLREEVARTAEAAVDRGDSESLFEPFLAQVAAAASAEDKKAIVDRFMAAHDRFPIVEENRVHFVYRADATDVALAGDMFGARREKPMTRVPGTDLFFYSLELEPDARLNYLFIDSFEKMIRDPLNPRETSTQYLTKDMETTFSGGETAMSWFAMPEWREPAHLAEAPADSRGRIESHELASQVLGRKIDLDVYLPHGYDRGGGRFPVAYVHGGRSAREHGAVPNSLDNLIGRSVEPVVVVFVDIAARGAKYSQAIADEVVPFVDAHYRTIASPQARANVGAAFSGVDALLTTLAYRHLFAKVATQSLFLFDQAQGLVTAALAGIGENPPQVYMDWGKYDLRSAYETWDMAAANRELAEKLRQQGVRVAGGEIHDGTDWSSWRNRTDRIFETLFPLGGS